VNLASLFVEITLCIVHEHHGADEETWLLLEKLICFDQEAVELVAVRLLDRQLFFKESLPLGGQLSLNEMGQNEILFIVGALDL
jgi:hypothetical protein